MQLFDGPVHHLGRVLAVGCALSLGRTSPDAKRGNLLHPCRRVLQVGHVGFGLAPRHGLTVWGYSVTAQGKVGMGGGFVAVHHQAYKVMA